MQSLRQVQSGDASALTGQSELFQTDVTGMVVESSELNTTGQLCCMLLMADLWLAI